MTAIPPTDLETLRSFLLDTNADALDVGLALHALTPDDLTALGYASLQELSEDLRQDVAAIVDGYGNLDHEGLLKVVYERYPAYAKKSRRRRTPTKPTE